MPFVHPTAIVEEGATIGEDAKVWHHAHVMAGASIGARCMLGKGVFVASGVRVGDGARVQNGVSLFAGVSLAEDVFVGPHAVFTNVARPRAFLDRKAEIAPTFIERGATIGAGAVIVCGHTIGAFAFVAAGAVVTHDVAPHALVMGNPARQVGWVSRAGQRLPSGPVATCPESGERYRVGPESCVLLEGEDSGAEAKPAPIAMQDLAAEHAALRPELERAFRRVVNSGQFVLGREVEQFEEEVAASLDAPFAVGVASGTDALLLALTALGVGPGDEVVTSPFSFFATAGVIARLGARPVFADIEPSTMNLSVAAVRAAITPRTKALLPVHLFGRPVDDALFELAERAGLPVVEDAAQALGARSARGPVGTLGTFGCFSFFPTKNLGALGDAGLVVTRDPALADRVRLLRSQGARPKYHHEILGGNHRIDALQAALLRVKLPHLPGWNARRRANAAAYDERLAGRLPTPPSAPGHVYHQYVVRVPERERVRTALAAQGIQTEVYYPEPLHLQPCFSKLGYSPGAMPEAERACLEALALPIHPGVDRATVERVAGALVRAVNGGG